MYNSCCVDRLVTPNTVVHVLCSGLYASNNRRVPAHVLVQPTYSQTDRRTVSVIDQL